MNKSLLIALISLFPSITMAQLSGTTYKDAVDSKAAKLTYVYNGVFGFIDKDSDGQIKGLLVDLMNEFEAYALKEKGISLTHEFVYVAEGDFSRFLDQIKNAHGGVFGLSNVSIKEERKKDFNFSPPFIDNVSLIVSNAKVKTLSSKDEISNVFKGMTAYTVAKSTYNTRLLKLKENYLPNLRLEYVPSGREIMEELANNDRSFAVLDLNFYIEALNRKYPIKRHSLFDIKEDQFGIIMPKSNDWSELLTEFLNSGFLQSSQYSEIISKNLGNAALRLLGGIEDR